jgi:acyl carrier protein
MIPLNEDRFMRVMRDFLDNQDIEAATLLTDIGLDSIAHFELLLALEEWGGFSVPDELFDSFDTFGRVYQYYIDHFDA